MYILFNLIEYKNYSVKIYLIPDIYLGIWIIRVF